LSETITFLYSLFDGYADDTLRAEIRPRPPVWREQAPIQYGLRRWYPLTQAALRAMARHAVSLAASYDVYCGVLPRVGHQGTQQAVTAARWLWCDIDGGSAGVEGARKLLASADVPAPHMVVISGNGLHVYWRLSEVVPLPDPDARSRFKLLLQRLCRAIDGEAPGAHADSSRADVASILRVPGTRNNKRTDQPRGVLLDTFQPDAEVHSYTWWRANLPALPAPPPPKQYSSDPMKVAAGLLRWAEKPYPEGKRHKDFVAAAAWLIRDVGIDRAQALELLTIKASVSPGQRMLTAAELEACVKWVR